MVQSAFSVTSDRLVDLNIAALVTICKYLGIDFDYSLCSTMNLNLAHIEHAGQWALKIAKQLDASEYLNPPGGRDIFRQEEWDAAGIKLKFTAMPDFTYDCRPYQFVEYLSILDVLMWNDPAKITQALRKSS